MKLLGLLPARLRVLDALQNCSVVGVNEIDWSSALKGTPSSLVASYSPRNLAMAKRSNSSMATSPSGGEAYIDST